MTLIPGLLLSVTKHLRLPIVACEAAVGQPAQLIITPSRLEDDVTLYIYKISCTCTHAHTHKIFSEHKALDLKN